MIFKAQRHASMHNPTMLTEKKPGTRLIGPPRIASTSRIDGSAAKLQDVRFRRAGPINQLVYFIATPLTRRYDSTPATNLIVSRVVPGHSRLLSSCDILICNSLDY